MEKCEVLTANQEKDLIRYVDPIGDKNFREGKGNVETLKNPTEWKCARNAVIVLLMSDAGLRVGEVVKLRYMDCYYACLPVLKVKVRSEVAKGGFEREVPLTRRLMFALSRFRNEDSFSGLSIMDNYMITRAQFGKQLTTRAIEKLLEKVGRFGMGIKIYPHMLRHTCATKLMRITDMPTVQRILGHRHLSSTEIYTHPNSEDIDLAIRGMEAGCRQPANTSVGKSGGAMRIGRDLKGPSRRLRGDNEGEPVDKPVDFQGNSGT